jgi:putative ABC transport system permease protein
VAESALVAVSVMVIITALLGLVATILSSLNERRRELAIWRAMGASPGTIVGLLVMEAALLATAGAVIGVAVFYAAIALLRPWIDAAFGIWLPVEMLTWREVAVLGGVVVAAIVAGLIPAVRAYRMSLADGMLVKI